MFLFIVINFEFSEYFYYIICFLTIIYYLFLINHLLFFIFYLSFYIHNFLLFILWTIFSIFYSTYYLFIIPFYMLYFHLLFIFYCLLLIFCCLCFFMIHVVHDIFQNSIRSVVLTWLTSLEVLYIFNYWYFILRGIHGLLT